MNIKVRRAAYAIFGFALPWLIAPALLMWVISIFWIGAETHPSVAVIYALLCVVSALCLEHWYGRAVKSEPTP